MENNKFVKRIQQLVLPPDRSAFLWGPRKTGKTTLLKQQFPHACWIDLLNYDTFLTLSRKPQHLRQIVEAQTSKTVVIDEVQKVPSLMDEIHWLMENRGLQFILSGSSARKFRRGTVNLLGGRAFEHFILQECWAYSHYSKADFPIAFWRTASGSEVDIILGEGEVAVEVKSSDKDNYRIKGLNLFKEEYRCKKSFVISREAMPRRISSIITILPWQNFCEMLWAGEIIK